MKATIHPLPYKWEVQSTARERQRSRRRSQNRTRRLATDHAFAAQERVRRKAARESRKHYCSLCCTYGRIPPNLVSPGAARCAACAAERSNRLRPYRQNKIQQELTSLYHNGKDLDFEARVAQLYTY